MEATSNSTMEFSVYMKLTEAEARALRGIAISLLITNKRQSKK